MLGVLAIIAVLSVGGIAGYSKAMEMYKINKWSANLVQIITDIQTANINQKSYGDRAGDITLDLQNADVIRLALIVEIFLVIILLFICEITIME